MIFRRTRSYPFSALILVLATASQVHAQAAKYFIEVLNSGRKLVLKYEGSGVAKGGQELAATSADDVAGFFATVRSIAKTPIAEIRVSSGILRLQKDGSYLIESATHNPAQLAEVQALAGKIPSIRFVARQAGEEFLAISARLKSFRRLPNGDWEMALPLGASEAELQSIARTLKDHPEAKRMVFTSGGKQSRLSDLGKPRAAEVSKAPNHVIPAQYNNFSNTREGHHVLYGDIVHSRVSGGLHSLDGIERLVAGSTRKLKIEYVTSKSDMHRLIEKGYPTGELPVFVAKRADGSLLYWLPKEATTASFQNDVVGYGARVAASDLMPVMTFQLNSRTVTYYGKNAFPKNFASKDLDALAKEVLAKHQQPTNRGAFKMGSIEQYVTHSIVFEGKRINVSAALAFAPRGTGGYAVQMRSLFPKW